MDEHMHMHMPPAEFLHFSESLPFKPIENEIFYVENRYNEDVNAYILQHYTHITQRFEKQGYRFVYLPKMMEELQAPEFCRYFNPSTGDTYHARSLEEDAYHHCILQHLIERQDLQPGLLSFEKGSIYHNEYNGFFYFPIEISGTFPPDWLFQNAVDYKRIWCHKFLPQDNVYYSLVSKGYYRWVAIHEQGECVAEVDFEEESLQLMEEIRVRVEKLRQHGIQEALIRHLFEPEIKLSRLKITNEYRIFLTDYQNREIEMGPLPKAVFFLFLRHPEGIVFKDLPDYQKELSNIYLELSGRSNITKLKESVKDATDPTQNSINEKCARIREAFLQHIDESIAHNYFVTGERGLAKKIILPRDLVEWECDF